ATMGPGANVAVDVLAGAAILGEDEDEPEAGVEEPLANAEFDEEDEEGEEDVAAELEAELDRAEAEAPLADWDEEEDVEGPQDDEQLAEQPEDPNAAKRFWFEHATGAGKTVAALGFV